MCGINGIIGKSGSTIKLEAMQSAIAHRGPDASMKYVNKQDFCFMGHNRLSIIDLSESANQPMFSNDNQKVIVYNGEIYNYLELKQELEKDYLFKTQSDTEVILAAYQKWGESCLNRFIGMFSFVIWDQRKQQLFAARDRYGVKPFFYSMQNDSFFFSSEIKGLWATGIPRIPNEHTWLTYWRKGLYDHSEATFWKDVQKLDAGCCLTFSLTEGLNIRRWYDLEVLINIEDNRSEDSITEELRYLLEDAVRLRFRSDVPVGICLSGGLDSSLLLGLIQKIKGRDFPIHAFTFYTGDDRYDELRWAAKMVENTSVVHHHCKLTAETIPFLAKEVSDAMDEPFGGIPTIGMRNVFKASKKLGIKVLLDGNGMDEAWAGYDYYQTAEHVLYDKGPIQGSKNANVLDSYLRSAVNRDVDSLIAPEFPDKIKQLQYRDLLYTKIPRGMRFADRNSMAQSIELREPFLDHRMVELGLKQKRSLKIREEKGKYLPRKIAQEMTPQTIVTAPKRPVQTPQREWLAEDLASWVEDILFKKDSSLLQWFDRKTLQELWSDYKIRRPDNSFYLWQLINSAMLLDK